jgi:hypothetical protein
MGGSRVLSLLGVPEDVINDAAGQKALRDLYVARK